MLRELINDERKFLPPRRNVNKQPDNLFIFKSSKSLPKNFTQMMTFNYTLEFINIYSFNLYITLVHLILY